MLCINGNQNHLARVQTKTSTLSAVRPGHAMVKHFGGFDVPGQNKKDVEDPSYSWTHFPFPKNIPRPARAYFYSPLPPPNAG